MPTQPFDRFNPDENPLAVVRHLRVEYTEQEPDPDLPRTIHVVSEPEPEPEPVVEYIRVLPEPGPYTLLDFRMMQQKERIEQMERMERMNARDAETYRILKFETLAREADWVEQPDGT